MPAKVPVAARTHRELLRALRERLAGVEDPPEVAIYGESLGAWASQNVFRVGGVRSLDAAGRRPRAVDRHAVLLAAAAPAGEGPGAERRPRRLRAREGARRGGGDPPRAALRVPRPRHGPRDAVPGPGAAVAPPGVARPRRLDARRDVRADARRPDGRHALARQRAARARPRLPARGPGGRRPGDGSSRRPRATWPSWPICWCGASSSAAPACGACGAASRRSSVGPMRLRARPRCCCSPCPPPRRPRRSRSCSPTAARATSPARSTAARRRCRSRRSRARRGRPTSSSVRRDGGEFVVRDDGAVLTAEAPCTAVDAHSARCPVTEGSGGLHGFARRARRRRRHGSRSPATCAWRPRSPAATART